MASDNEQWSTGKHTDMIQSAFDDLYTSFCQNQHTNTNKTRPQSNPPSKRSQIKQRKTKVCKNGSSCPVSPSKPSQPGKLNKIKSRNTSKNKTAVDPCRKSSMKISQISMDKKSPAKESCLELGDSSTEKNTETLIQKSKKNIPQNSLGNFASTSMSLLLSDLLDALCVKCGREHSKNDPCKAIRLKTVRHKSLPKSRTVKANSGVSLETSSSAQDLSKVINRDGDVAEEDYDEPEETLTKISKIKPKRSSQQKESYEMKHQTTKHQCSWPRKEVNTKRSTNVDNLSNTNSKRSRKPSSVTSTKTSSSEHCTAGNSSDTGKQMDTSNKPLKAKSKVSNLTKAVPKEDEDGDNLLKPDSHKVTKMKHRSKSVQNKLKSNTASGIGTERKRQNKRKVQSDNEEQKKFHHQTQTPTTERPERSTTKRKQSSDPMPDLLKDIVATSPKPKRSKSSLTREPEIPSDNQISSLTALERAGFSHQGFGATPELLDLFPELGAPSTSRSTRTSHRLDTVYSSSDHVGGVWQAIVEES